MQYASTISALLLLALITCVQSWAQVPRWYHDVVVYENMIGGEPTLLFDMAEDEWGYHWYATRDGLFRFDGYEYTPAIGVARDTLSSTGFSPNKVAYLAEGQLVLGSRYGQIATFSTEGVITQRWDLFADHDMENKPVIMSTRTIFTEGDSVIWVGNSLGLRRIFPGHNEIGCFTAFEEPDTIKGWIRDPNIVWSIANNANNADQLIVGMQGGLAFFDKRKEVFTKTLLEGHAINTVYHDTERNTIYASAWGRGLFEIDCQTWEYRQYPVDPYGSGIWWIGKFNDVLILSGTEYGFHFFDPATRQLLHVQDPDHNIPLRFEESAVQGSPMTDRWGDLWFRLPAHRLRIQVHAPMGAADPPQLRMTSYQSSGDLPRRVQDNARIILTPGVQNCQIRFAAINPRRPDHVRYAFRIGEGDWSDAGTSRQVSFNNLGHGTHDIFVRAEDPSAFGTIETAVASVQVTLPVWRRPFFRVGGVLLLLLVLAVAWWIRSRQIRSRERIKALERNYAELELTALRAQMNPHFMFNSLNSIRNFILQSEPREAAEYLSRFAHLIRMILQNSREQYISLQEELDALFLYIDLEKLRFESGFEFNCIIDERIDLKAIRIPPMILQPYVENAIWHGLMHKDEPGILIVSVGRQNGQVECVIEDDGIGRDRARALKSKSATRHKSMGLGITEDRLAIHNRMHQLGIEIEIIDKYGDSREPEGTRVVVSIPDKKQQ
ncbi:MAG: histidine kinase [Saprospiraceae bacterium]|nr:histidine kinase [Saprospiraceae bacterium]